MKKINKYGIIENQLVIIYRYVEYRDKKFYIASLSKGYPRFSVEIKEVYVPEDQTAIKLLFDKKITKVA